MGRVTHQTTEPGPALASYLRRQYPHHGAKRLARDIGCTPKAAANLLSGHWPNARLFASVVRRFGQDALDALFGSDIDRARLEAEVRQLEEALETKRAALSEAASAHARDPRRLAAPEERAAA